MIEDLLVPLVSVAIAELGDKTQLSILLLSSKTAKHLQLLLGIILGFFITDGAAILAGSFMATILPMDFIRWLSAALFMMFGILTLRYGSTAEKEKIHLGNPFLSGFTLIFFAEWGDKTQIASGVFATRYDAILVLSGTLAALTLLSVAAVYLGKLISDRIDRRLVTLTAGIYFIVIGISFLIM